MATPRQKFFFTILASFFACTIFAAALRAAPAPAPEPLPARIDKAVEATFPGTLAATAGDADFLRRIYLDLTGTLPTAAQARAFFADTAAEKRAKLIDQLLASREFARQMAVTFDVWLMERRPEKHVKTAEWHQFLFDSFATNKPFNQLAREILSADGADEKLRPAARFLLDREAEPNLLTRDVGRIFFGMDLSCAQCHDHPRIDDYVQRDYQGLYSFFNRTYLFTDDKAKKSFLAEKAEGDVSYTSVFTKESSATGPRLPGGVTVVEPILAKGDEYLVKPDPKDKNVRPVPRFSRRAQLATLATDGANRAFNRNIANRLWKHLMGRGLVDPVDEVHSGNPAPSPALLDMLADEFAAMKFDTRAFLRQLALTKTYQRSIDLPTALTSPDKPAASRVAEIDEESKRLADTAAQSDELHKKSLAELAPAQKARDPIVAELGKTNAIIADVKKAADAAAQAQADLEKLIATKRDALKSLLAVVTNAQDALAKLAPDTNLTAALELFKTRTTKLTNEIDTAAKDVPAKAAATKAAAEKLAATELTAKPVLARLAEADKVLRKVEEDLAAAIARRQGDKTALRAAERRLALVRLFAEYEAAGASLQASRATAIDTKVRLAAAQATLARHDELAAAQQSLDAASAALAVAQKNFAPTNSPSPVPATNAPVAAATSPPPKTAAPAPPSAASTNAASPDAALAKIQAAQAAEARHAQARAAFAKAAAEIAATTRRDITNLQAQVKAADDKVAADKARLGDAQSKLGAAFGNAFAVGVFVALTPEQLAWSMMKSAGLVAAQQTAGEAEFDKKNPVTATNATDVVRLAARASHVEQFIFEKLRGNVGQFAGLFGNSAGEPQDVFYATADQALFFSNAGVVRGWLAPSAGNLTDRCAKLDDAKALAEELYLSTLTRLPADDELAAVKKALDARPKEKPAAVQDLAWGLLTSVEFRFKH